MSGLILYEEVSARVPLTWGCSRVSAISPSRSWRLQMNGSGQGEVRRRCARGTEGTGLDLPPAWTFLSAPACGSSLLNTLDAGWSSSGGFGDVLLA